MAYIKLSISNMLDIEIHKENMSDFNYKRLSLIELEKISINPEDKKRYIIEYEKFKDDIVTSRNIENYEPELSIREMLNIEIHKENMYDFKYKRLSLIELEKISINREDTKRYISEYEQLKLAKDSEEVFCFCLIVLFMLVNHMLIMDVLADLA